MAYGIIRVEKVKRAAVGAMQYHNDRLPGEHSNEDIDASRTAENVELVKHGNYHAEVNDRIERYRTSERKVRKDAVVLCEGIATASPEFFDGKSREEVMRYFGDVFEFVKTEAGEENLIHFTIHMDETTPHAHFGFTPIKDGSLSWKKFFDSKLALRAFQDRHWEQVSKRWGLARGEKSEDTNRRHKDTQQMKHDAQRELRETQKRLECLRQEETDLAAEVADLEAQTLEPAPETLSKSVEALCEGRGAGKREEALAREVEGLREDVKAAERGIKELERGLPALRERFENLGNQVRHALERLGELPQGLSELAMEIGRSLGLKPHEEEPISLRSMAHEAQVTSKQLSRQDGRDDGWREWQAR